MRVATSPHHTNPRSATLDFWRKTSDLGQYRKLQARRKKQINMPTSSTHNKARDFTLNLEGKIEQKIILKN